jgi:hypothetical protein
MIIRSNEFRFLLFLVQCVCSNSKQGSVCHDLYYRVTLIDKLIHGHGHGIDKLTHGHAHGHGIDKLTTLMIFVLVKFVVPQCNFQTGKETNVENKSQRTERIERTVVN